MLTEDFDRIYSLGFLITIDWNMCFTIEYDCETGPIVILLCSYEKCTNIKFEEIIESSVDIFYEWYNKHKDKIDDLTEDDLFDITLGNITKRVKRDLNIDKLL
jgi:hypothetical protein